MSPGFSRLIGPILSAALLSLSGFPALAQMGSAPPPSAAAFTAAPTAMADLPNGPIQAGDIVSVSVLGEPNLTGQYRVASDGTIPLPMAGQIAVAEKLPTEAASSIAQELRTRKLLKQPQVTVNIMGRLPKTAALSGAIANQGQVLLRGGTRLSDILEPAGILPGSDLSRVVITRGDKEFTVNYQDFRNGNAADAEHNPTLTDGDKIYIYATRAALPEGIVRINGEVKKPGQISLTAQGLTAGQLIQQSEGVTDNADRENIFVQRGPNRIPVPFKEIQAGDTTKDIVLQDKDELMIPRTEKPKLFSVQGAVRGAGQFPLTTRTTLLEAIAKAGGTIDGAKEKEIKIRRLTGAGDSVAEFNYNIHTGKDAATELQPGDVIFVPFPKNRPNALGQVLPILGSFGWLLF